MARATPAVLVFACLVVMTLCVPAYAIYEDQQGVNDFHKAFLGPIRRVAFPPGGSAKKHVFVAAEAGVLASLQLRTGEILWRNLLDPLDTVDALVAQEASLVAVSGGGRFLRSWQAATGDLAWEVELEGAARTCAGISLHDLTDADGDGVVDVAVVAHGMLQMHSGVDGLLLWAANLHQQEGFCPQDVLIDSAARVVAIAGVDPGGDAAHAVALAMATGVTEARAAVDAPGGQPLETARVFQPIAGEEFALAAFSPAGASVVTIVLSAPAGPPAPAHTTDLASILPSGLSAVLEHVSRGGTAVMTLTGAAGAAPAIAIVRLVAGAASGALLTTAAGSVFGWVAAADGAPAAVGIIDQGAETLRMRVLDLAAGQTLSDDSAPFSRAQHGAAVGLALQSFAKRDGGHGWRALVRASDEGLALLQQGAVVWRREEALATVTRALFVDLPVKPFAVVRTDAAAGAGDAPTAPPPMGARIASQITFQMLQIKSQFKLATAAETAELARMRRAAGTKTSPAWDKDGFRKLLVVLTRTGKLLALHNGDGRVVWSRFYGDALSGAAALDALAIWDTPHTVHAAPELIIIGAQAGGAGPAFASWVNAHTGAELRRQALPSRPTHVLDAGGRLGARCVVLVGHDSRVTPLHAPHPQWAALWAAGAPTLAFPVADDTGVSGWGFRRNPAGEWVAQQRWAIALALGEKLLAVAARRRDEVVHSAVRVLGSRAVLFKYLNPSLLLVAVEAPGDVLISLVDAVTGHAVYHVRHAGARGPVQATLSENWAVYSLWSSATGRYEVSSLELYDDAATKRRRSVADAVVGAVLGGNATARSSSLAPPAVRVLGQSFYLPLSTTQLAVTVTARSITPRQLLVGTAGGQVMALDRRFLDPRRPLQPTQEDREEGLIPYVDTLPVMATSFATYNQKVARLRRVEAAPSRLESTSLLLAWGLDLYFTRVTPSRTYDLLTDDFSYGLLTLTIVTLLVATAVSQHMLRDRDLKSKWR